MIVPPAKSASSTPPADLRLSLEVRGYLRAVVFDANAFGLGRPDLAFLEDLARRLYTIGIETWVPEPVAWEWAQHLADDWEKVQTATAAERKQLRRARLTGHASPYADKRAVIDAFLEGLEAVAHLAVIPLPPESALLALKDQILLIPPGRRKGDVKTGASDSAWLRAVLEEVDGDPARLLLVSQDKDVKAAFVVRVPMSFDIRDGSVIAARSEDEASVFLEDDRYSDPGEAAAELLDALRAVPGLTPPEWPEASGVMDLVAGADATPVSMEVGEPLGEWRLHVTVGDDTAELRCVYDDSGLVSDREDTFYVFPPYHAEFRGDHPASLNPFWALNQWIIART